MSSSVIRSIVESAVLGAALFACAHESAPPPQTEVAAAPTPAPAPETHTTSAIVSAQPSQSGVNVSDEIRKACEIKFDDVGSAPKFDFDKSDVLDRDRDVLAQIASCVTSGPLKGQAIRLIGRADPRGEEEYNMGLGSSRAASVQSYLLSFGVDPAKVTTTSRGELDATGTDESTWQIDRRVDIVLAH